MFTYLVVINCFVTDLYTDNIANMKHQLHHIHLEQCFIQQNQIKIAKIMLALLCLYFSSYIFVGKGAINNIKC